MYEGQDNVELLIFAIDYFIYSKLHKLTNSHKFQDKWFLNTHAYALASIITTFLQHLILIKYDLIIIN